MVLVEEGRKAKKLKPRFGVRQSDCVFTDLLLFLSLSAEKSRFVNGFVGSFSQLAPQVSSSLSLVSVFNLSGLYDPVLMHLFLKFRFFYCFFTCTEFTGTWLKDFACVLGLKVTKF